MLDIEYKGGNAIALSTKKTEVVIDPNVALLGLKPLQVADKVELATEARLASGVESVKIAIESPGDYEVGDFSIHGVAARRHIDAEGSKSTIYRIEVGDIVLGVLGNIDPSLTEDQQEEIGVIDILVLPIGGGGYTLDATSAVTLVRQLEPKAVIPVHYADDHVKYEVPQDVLETFTKELSAPVEDTGVKYKLKTAASLPQALTVIKLDRS